LCAAPFASPAAFGLRVQRRRSSRASHAGSRTARWHPCAAELERAVGHQARCVAHRAACASRFRRCAVRKGAVVQVARWGAPSHEVGAPGTTCQRSPELGGTRSGWTRHTAPNQRRAAQGVRRAQAVAFLMFQKGW